MSVFFGPGKSGDYDEQFQEPEDQWLKERPNAVPVAECCCPSVVVYLIESDCLIINNSGCPDWDFCDTGFVPVNGCRKGE